MDKAVELKRIAGSSILSPLLCVMLLTGCGSDRSVGAANVIVAQFGHVFLYLPLYVAERKGFFDKRGLKVSIVSTGGDDKTFAAVASGSAQFGVADPTFTAIARAQGGGGKVIASLVNGVPFWGVTYNQAQPAINTADGFKGLRIATYQAPSTNYATMDFTLKQDHIDAQIVQGTFGALLALLKAGKADIAMELEPNASLAAKDGAKIVYSPSRRFKEFAFTGVTVSDSYLKEQPAKAQAFVDAVSEAIAFVRKDADGALVVAADEFPDVPKDVLRSALQRLVADGVIPQSALLTEAAWRNAIAVREAVGDLKGDAPYADNVDMDLVKRSPPR